MMLDMMLVWGFVILSPMAEGKTAIIPVVAPSFAVCESARVEMMARGLKMGKVGAKYTPCEKASIAVLPYTPMRPPGGEVTDTRGCTNMGACVPMPGPEPTGPLGPLGPRA
jgi:hypothetical protein